MGLHGDTKKMMEFIEAGKVANIRSITHLPKKLYSLAKRHCTSESN